jgi:hypothetical protein
MKNFTRLLLSAIVLVAALQAHGQTYFQIGTGTATNSSSGYPAPFGDYYEATRQQYLYRASELTAAGATAGTITHLRFNVTALNGSTSHENYTISLLQTSSTALGTTTWESGATTVFGPTNYSPVLGNNSFDIIDFTWDGTSNILIDICHGAANAASASTWSNNASVAYTSLAFNGSRSYGSDNVTGSCSFTGTGTGSITSQNATRRPNASFGFAAACSDPLGLSVTNVTPMTADLSWTSPSPAPSNGFQWAVTTSATPPGSGTAESGTTVTATGLTAGTTYYAHVRSNCGGAGFSGWATSASFVYVNGDNCSNAIDLGLLTSPYSGTTVGATNNFTNSCAFGNTSPDLVFYIDVPAGSDLTIGQTVNR